MARINVGACSWSDHKLGSGSAPCVLEISDPDLVLVRFHGRNSKMWYARVKRTAERFNYFYSETDLQLVESAREIHLLFNNNAHDSAIQNARQLRMLLRSSLSGNEIVAAPIEATRRQGMFDQMLDWRPFGVVISLSTPSAPRC